MDNFMTVIANNFWLIGFVVLSLYLKRFVPLALILVAGKAAGEVFLDNESFLESGIAMILLMMTLIVFEIVRWFQEEKDRKRRVADREAVKSSNVVAIVPQGTTNARRGLTPPPKPRPLRFEDSGEDDDFPDIAAHRRFGT